MNAKVRQIEVDEETALLFEARAGALGMTVSELLADIASNIETLSADLSEMRSRNEGPWSPEILAEDARRLAEFKRTREGVPWEEIDRWMQSWGNLTSFLRPSPANYEGDHLVAGGC
jgi:hypothetical protein